MKSGALKANAWKTFAVAGLLALAACAKHGDSAPSTPPPAQPTVATGATVVKCSAGELSDYQTALKSCVSIDNGTACKTAIDSFFARNPQIDCVDGNKVELRASQQVQSDLEEILSSPIAADSTEGLCGEQVESDYASIVKAGCKASGGDAKKTSCIASVREFLNRYPNVDCHPEAARAGEPLRAWRLKAVVDQG